MKLTIIKQATYFKLEADGHIIVDGIYEEIVQRGNLIQLDLMVWNKDYVDVEVVD